MEGIRRRLRDFKPSPWLRREYHVTYSKLSKEKEVMTINEVNQEVTYGPKTGPSGRSDISAVRQVGGLAVARWKPMRRLMRTGKFGVVAGTVIFSGAIYFNT